MTWRGDFAVKAIEINDRFSLQSVAAAMKNGEPFMLITDDEKFDPLSYDRHSAEIWIGAAGGGVLMTGGLAFVALAFLDPEPTSKLSLLVGGGILTTLAGGGVILTILVTRSGYKSRMRRNPKTGRIEWTLEPRRAEQETP
jgi:hypothetical protein